MYKKYINKLGVLEGYVHQILLIMRLITIILIMGIMQVSASTFAQRITLSEKNATLSKVFDRISDQCGYNFVFTSDLLKGTKPVTINVKDTELDKVLEQIFANQPVSFSIEDKTVVIKAKEKGGFENLVANFRAITVRGKILDEKGQPLVGATVAIKGKNRSVKTDQNGAFYLENVGENDKLVISFIGYQSREVNAASDMGNLTMVLADSKLEEVIVNAGYYTVKDSERTGSIARITSKDIEKQPVTNVLATMQGRMAGVQIIQDAGTPGGGFQIKIRGQNSLRSDANEPLFVIDGVPYASQYLGASEISTSTPVPTSPLNGINVADIESIEVLKDADATAIYGSRGANGVVLITTKKGQVGKTKVSTTVSKGAGSATRFPKLMGTEQYLNMRRKAFESDGITVYPESAYDLNGTWNQNSQTDWQEKLSGDISSINDIRASLTGGSATTQYLFSATYRDETTVTPGDFKYKKGGSHFNLNHVSDDQRFHFSLSAGYTRQNNHHAGANLVRDSRNLAPNAPNLYNEQGDLNWQDDTFNNPLAALNAKVISNVSDLLANTMLSYNLVKGLQLKVSMGFSDTRSEETATTLSTIYNPSYGLGSEESYLIKASNNRQSWILEPQVNWQGNFGKSKLDALVGATFQELASSRLSQMGYGFSNNNLINNLGSASDIYLLGDEDSKYRYQAFFGRINYNFNGRYILNVTGRRDGSSRFGPSSQFALFGAVGAAWVFSEEAFLKNNNLLSFGKFRLSYGTTGSDQIGDYQFYNTFSQSNTQYQGVVGLTPTRLFNPDFAWEKNRKLEAALELGFLQDRLQLGVSIYRNRSSNQLVGIPLPAITGFSSLNANLGATVQNRGIEITLQSVNAKTKNFSWSSSLNFSRAENKLISFPGLEGSTYVNRYVIGKSINIEKLYHYEGLNKTTGIYEFEDIDQNGIVSGYADRTLIRDLMPRFFGGLQNQLQYKSFELDFLFQFVSQDTYTYQNNLPGSPYNQLASTGDFWSAPGDNATYQRLSTGLNSDVVNAYSLYTSSNAAIEDGSFIRLKNISLSYDFSKHFKNKLKGRVFVQGQNILTITSYSGGDPEFRYTGFLPPLKIYTAGIQLSI